MREPTEGMQILPTPRETRRGTGMATALPTHPARAGHVGRLEAPPVTFVTRTLPEDAAQHTQPTERMPGMAGIGAADGLGSSSALPALPVSPAARTRAVPAVDPDVWLIALPLPNGGMRSLEGAGRAGAIRVSRPYGHLRSIRPVVPAPLFGEGDGATTTTGRARRSRKTTGALGANASAAQASGSLGSSTAAPSGNLPAHRPLPQVISAVEVETDAGIFRVERPDGILGHSDMGWALAHLESGEPDSQVPVSRRQLALLLTLLPTPEDRDHPEQDPVWGWAHKLRGPWERGPLHGRGRLGRLIAFDPDDTGKGMHRACFELLGTEEIVWAVGVPCFRTGSVYELVPIGKGLHPSRWLTWPLAKGRKRANAPEPPTWEIARIVYRVGAPRWPLAGIVEPLGPMGVAG